MFRNVKFALVFAVLFGMSAVVQADMIDGSLFYDHFTYGTTYDPSLWNDDYQNQGSTMTYDPTSPGLVTMHCTTLGNCRLRSVPITFPDNEWGAEVRFKVTGTLDNYDGLAPAVFDSTRVTVGGIDLGVREDASGPTGSTYSLVWETSDINTANIDVIATGLNKDTFYTIAAYLKADGNVDIYLGGDDLGLGDYLTTRTAIAGTPVEFFVGDTWTNAQLEDLIVDYVKVGGLVPEPSTLALLATGLIGLLAYAWRKRK